MMANILLSPAAVALYCLGVAAAAAGVIRRIWMRKPKAVPPLYQRIRAAEEKARNGGNRYGQRR